MDKSKFLLAGILLFQTFASLSQTFWKVENEYEDQILLTVELNSDKNTFVAYSRKDALKELAGVFTFTLAKAAGKLKYPEIVYIEGKTSHKNDTLFLNGNFTYFDKQFLFSAAISGEHFDGRYTDNRNRTHPLVGAKVSDNKPIRDYCSIINTAFSLTGANLVNPLWLKTTEWNDFREKVNGLKPKIADDYELAATFFWLGKKLPFSPYEITKKRSRNKSGNRKNSGFREFKPNTALFDGNSFPSDQHDMDSISSIISRKGYTGLIIDLRGNSRLNPVSANILMSYLSSKAFSPGVFITRKWSDNNKIIPPVSDFHQLFRGISDKGFQPGTIYKDQGRYMEIVPGAKFKGKIYVLSDSKTSRIAEVLLYILKNEKIATIVGQKSAGMPYSAGTLTISGEYDLILPDSEFFTSEGIRVSDHGISPDVELSGDEVMKYMAKLL